MVGLGCIAHARVSYDLKIL
jgi:hypothetical protein